MSTYRDNAVVLGSYKFGEADREEINALMAAGLVLFLLTLIINAIANTLVNSLGKTGR